VVGQTLSIRRGEIGEVLVTRLDREEALFRLLEGRVLRARLEKGFIIGGEPDVDCIISFSLSVQNRRKSHAGQSRELHIEALLADRGITFGRGAVTVNSNKPDFIILGIDAHSDPSFPVARLTMLGSKSSAKDRWRQVLAEARRIDRTHLLTLEPGITEAQATQMAAENLRLVIPASLHATFRPTQNPSAHGRGGVCCAGAEPTVVPKPYTCGIVARWWFRANLSGDVPNCLCPALFAGPFSQGPPVLGHLTPRKTLDRI
jgi:hypothetical protein